MDCQINPWSLIIQKEWDHGESGAEGIYPWSLIIQQDGDQGE